MAEIKDTLTTPAAGGQNEKPKPSRPRRPRNTSNKPKAENAGRAKAETAGDVKNHAAANGKGEAGGKPAADKPRQTRKPANKPAAQKGENAAKAGGAPKQNTAKSPAAPRNNAGTQKAGTQKRRSRSAKSGGSEQSLRIVSLGGLDEIGKNVTLYEYGGDMMLVDCGMTFPDEDMPGVDIVIPDFTYILQNKDKIKGLVVTHGHEDHIGAIPYLLKEFNVPVYGTRLTIGLISGKLKEHRLLKSAKLHVIQPGDVVELGAFSVEAIHVNHSIPDAVAYAIRCPAGLVVQTGDYKIDTTPIDSQVIDLGRFAELGKEGVLALLSDSTNAERPGFTASERIVGDSFSNLFKRADDNHQRIIVASFSSNIHRVQQIVDEAVKHDRKVAVSGRSMLNVVGIASELGYLKVPEGVIIDIDMIRRYKPEQVVIVTTGSQGEPMSALHRMAFGDHRQVAIVPGDMIIISATPIPGNEKTVGKVVNELLKLGADVIYERMYDVHVSGHACQEEMKLMLSIVKPQYFIPVHGERKMLVKHAGLAQAVGSVVLRDRKHLAEDGLFVVVITMDASTGEVVAGPDLISRGFVYVKESEKLLDDAKEVACQALSDCYVNGIRDWSAIKIKVRDAISKFLYEKTKRSPMILPIIMEI